MSRAAPIRSRSPITLDNRCPGRRFDLLGATDGQVLCFLPGAPEIRRAVSEAAAEGRERRGKSYRCTDRSMRTSRIWRWRPSARRRVIIATNIAENIAHRAGASPPVIDAGLQKVRAGTTRSGASTAWRRSASPRTPPISAPAVAGRLAPGLVRRPLGRAGSAAPAPRAGDQPHRSVEHRARRGSRGAATLARSSGSSRRAKRRSTRPLTLLGRLRADPWTREPHGARRTGAAPAVASAAGVHAGGRPGGARQIAQAVRALVRAPFPAAAPPHRLRRTSCRRSTTGVPCRLTCSARPDSLRIFGSRIADSIGDSRAGPIADSHATVSRTSTRGLISKRRGVFAALCWLAIPIVWDSGASPGFAGSPPRIGNRARRWLQRAGVRDGEFLVALDVSRNPHSNPHSNPQSNPQSATRTPQFARVRIASRIEREWLSPTATETVHRFDKASGKGPGLGRRSLRRAGTLGTSCSCRS